MIKVTIHAFGSEHEFIDSYVEGDIDTIINTPVLYLVSGDEQKIEDFASILNSDWTVLVTEVGEYIFFGYEYFSESEDLMIEMLDLCYERGERTGDDEIAA